MNDQDNHGQLIEHAEIEDQNQNPPQQEHHMNLSGDLSGAVQEIPLDNEENKQGGENQQK